MELTRRQALMVDALDGIDKALVARSPQSIFGYAGALLTCAEHGGSHHMAVVNSGRTLLLGQDGIDCLRALGVKV